jgi:hypothetical protein
VGKTANPNFVQNNASAPRGCFYYTTSNNDAYLNRDAVGAGYSGAQLLCAVLATTGAPLTRRCADARALRAARGRWV